MTLNFITEDITEAKELALAYIANGGNETSPDNYTKYNDWYSSLKVVFLEQLLEKLPVNGTPAAGDVTLQILEKVDKDLSVTMTEDPECKQRWFPLGIQLNYTNVTEPAKTFISSMGRLKYLTPIYSALLAANKKDTAIEWYNLNKDFYHPSALLQL